MGGSPMEFETILEKLDKSSLKRESVSLRGYDNIGVTWRNLTDETLSATVNGTIYTEIFKICLVNKEKKVILYINNIGRFNLNKYDLESVSTFSIS